MKLAFIATAVGLMLAPLSVAGGIILLANAANTSNEQAPIVVMSSEACELRIYEEMEALVQCQDRYEDLRDAAGRVAMIYEQMAKDCGLYTMPDPPATEL